MKEIRVRPHKNRWMHVISALSIKICPDAVLLVFQLSVQEMRGSFSDYKPIGQEICICFTTMSCEMICGLEWPLLFLEYTTMKSLSLWTIWFLNWLTLLWKRDSLTTCVHFPQHIVKESCKQHIWGSSKLVRKQRAVMRGIWGRIQISLCHWEGKAFRSQGSSQLRRCAIL